MASACLGSKDLTCNKSEPSKLPDSSYYQQAGRLDLMEFEERDFLFVVKYPVYQKCHHTIFYKLWNKIHEVNNLEGRKKFLGLCFLDFV